MTKKLDIKQVAHPYKKEYATTYYELSLSGFLPHQIATHLGIPQKFLNKWVKDNKNRDFVRAVRDGETACHSYWTNQLMSAKDRTGIDRASTVLKTWFKEWNIAQKKEIEVENKAEKMTLEELAKQFQYSFLNPDIKNDLIDLLTAKPTKGKPPNLKVVNGSENTKKS